VSADIIHPVWPPHRNWHILTADGHTLDWRDAQLHSAKFAVMVTGWIDDIVHGRSLPSESEVRAAILECFPGAALFD
jgi:hypothetical protein